MAAFTTAAFESKVVYTPLQCTESGVASSDVLAVVSLHELILADVALYGEAALAEPLMLLRFLRARELDVEAAADMWRKTHEWRAAKLPRVLAETGAFSKVPHAALDASPRRGEWSWRMHSAGAVSSSSVRAKLGSAHGQSRRLELLASDGAPVLVWRLGCFDMEGVAREALWDAMMMQQAAHLEDALQTSRALSNKACAQLRCRVIIDLRGLRLRSVLKNIQMVKKMIALGKEFYPEVTASVTLIGAPFGFQTVWKAISYWLNDTMRAKVQIVGTDFRHALTTHALIADLRTLPKALGGEASDATLAPCLPVPVGAGDDLHNDPAPPFMDDTAI